MFKGRTISWISTKTPGGMDKRAVTVKLSNGSKYRISDSKQKCCEARNVSLAKMPNMTTFSHKSMFRFLYGSVEDIYIVDLGSWQEKKYDFPVHWSAFSYNDKYVRVTVELAMLVISTDKGDLQVLFQNEWPSKHDVCEGFNIKIEKIE